MEAQTHDILSELESLDSVEEVGGVDEETVVRREKLKVDLAAVMHMEEINWRQNFRAKWVKEGDRNTKYFHSLASRHRRKNYVATLLFDSKEVEGMTI